MTRRQFRGADGTLWDVWDVHPADASGDNPYDRRHARRGDATDSPPPASPLLDPDLEAGWLCFQSGGDRRRFAPIPPQWSELPDGVLRVMVDIATVVGPGIDLPETPRPESGATEA